MSNSNTVAAKKNKVSNFLMTEINVGNVDCGLDCGLWIYIFHFSSVAVRRVRVRAVKLVRSKFLKFVRLCFFVRKRYFSDGKCMARSKIKNNQIIGGDK